MSRRAAPLLIATALATAPAPARAEPDLVHVSAELRIGAAKAPFYTDALPETTSEFTQARSMILAASVRIAPALFVGARLPAAPSTVRQPAGSYADEKALGNPELNADWLAPPRAFGGHLVHFLVRGAIGLPLAEHGSAMSLVQNRVVALSSALDGWRNPELYHPGVLPLTLSGRASLEPRPWGAELAGKLPVLVRIGDASLPDEADTHPVGFEPTLEARGLFAPVDWFTAELGASLAAHLLPAVSPAGRSDRDGRLQPAIEPGLRFWPGGGVSLSTGFSAALGGPLASTFAIGLAASLER
jgi:hypothetical protein